MILWSESIYVHLVTDSDLPVRQRFGAEQKVVLLLQNGELIANPASGFPWMYTQRRPVEMWMV